MSDKNKGPAIEVIKTCLIILLSISALLLIFQTQSFRFFWAQGSWGSIFAPGRTQKSGTEAAYQEAAKPVNIVLSAEGGHYAGDAQALYENCGALLGEALGSSREPSAATAADWRNALSTDSIYFEYADPVRLSVLAGWFGTEINHRAGDMLVRRLCIAAGSAGPVLYYLDAESGEVYRCGTAASSASLAALIAAYLPNESYFVFETDGAYSSVDPYMLLRGGLESLPLLSVTNPLGLEIPEEQLLSCFGMNAYISSHYAEQGGNTVYVEGDATLRAGSHGFVSFRQGSDGALLPVFSQEHSSEAAAIAAGRQFLANAAAVVGGDGVFYLRSCDRTGENYTLCFSLFVGSMQVFLPGDAPAARLQIENGHITQAEVCFRRYTLGQEQVSLLPARQAAAVAESLGWPEAAPGWLDDSSQSVISPQWLLRGGL